jgi:hypothetical protein
MPRVAVITAAHRITGAATRLLWPTDFDADTGPVDPVDIATAPRGGLRLSAKGRRLTVATHGPSGEPVGARRGPRNC